MTITGKVLDVDYANTLARHPDLLLEQIMLLDKVQKKKPLSKDEEKHLRTQHLIEGRKPNYYITKDIAQKTDQKAEYSKFKGFDKQYYLDLILKAVEEHGALNRKEVDRLLRDKRPEVLTEDQKTNRIRNLLGELKKQGKIEVKGWSAKAIWVLPESKKTKEP